MRHFVAVNTLPQTIRSALDRLRYFRADIAVEASETFQMAGASGQGSRRFVVAVNLATGERRETWGSWGGANMFNPTNAVDLDTESHPIPSGFVVIEGSSGEKVYATIVAPPSVLAPLLPTKAETTEKEQAILYAYGGLKSGPYRKQTLERAGVTQADIDAAISRGFLKRSANGATQITTEGKNARDGKSRFF